MTPSKEEVKNLYAELAGKAGYESTDDLLRWLENLVNNFNLDENIPKVDYFRSKIDIKAFFDDPTINTNPLDINLHTVFDMMEI